MIRLAGPATGRTRCLALAAPGQRQRIRWRRRPAPSLGVRLRNYSVLAGHSAYSGADKREAGRLASWRR